MSNVTINTAGVDAFREMLLAATSKGLGRAANSVYVAAIKLSMQKTGPKRVLGKSGKMKNAKRLLGGTRVGVNNPSAPGTPPAVQLGLLRANILAGEINQLKWAVGVPRVAKFPKKGKSDLRYASVLELNPRWNRPFMMPAFRNQRLRGEARSLFARVVKSEMRRGMKGGA